MPSILAFKVRQMVTELEGNLLLQKQTKANIDSLNIVHPIPGAGMILRIGPFACIAIHLAEKQGITLSFLKLKTLCPLTDKKDKVGLLQASLFRIQAVCNVNDLRLHMVSAPDPHPKCSSKKTVVSISFLHKTFSCSSQTS